MATDPHRVTTTHLRHLVARTGPVDHGHTALVDTDTGINIVAPGKVLEPGSGVRRLLLTRIDVFEDADRAGLTVSAYLRENEGRIVADLNALISSS
jgi:hypothetical protein